MKPKLIKLFAEMAELTKPLCAQCRVPNSCCSPEYCDFTETNYPRNSKNLMLDENNNCLVPPHLRPMCTLHVCSVNSLGFIKDPKINKQYFKLRDKINEIS